MHDGILDLYMCASVCVHAAVQYMYMCVHIYVGMCVIAYTCMYVHILCGTVHAMYVYM